jgi:hypothetical protein
MPARHRATNNVTYRVKEMTKRDRQSTNKRNIEARYSSQGCCAKAISITYYDCVSVALVIQQAMRMRRIILSPVACLAVRYFSKLSHKRHDFGGKRFLKM